MSSPTGDSGVEPWGPGSDLEGAGEVMAASSRAVRPARDSLVVHVRVALSRPIRRWPRP